MIKSQKRKTIGEIVKSQLKEYIIENLVIGQTTAEKDMQADITVKLNLNINVKINQGNPECVSRGICK